MGLQMPNYGDTGMGDDDDDDDDLEAELQKLQQDIGGGSRSKANKGKSGLLFDENNDQRSFICLYTGGAAHDLREFHNDVNRLLHDIDQPINDDDLSDVDDEDLLVRIYI